MKNEDIIFSHRMELMKKGIIKGSGETLVTEEGEEIEIPEEIHTYAGWKAQKRQVKKGEHAIAQFDIWKHTTKKVKEESEEKNLEQMFMTTAFFFKEDQTEETE